jgi:hypothetical protein
MNIRPSNAYLSSVAITGAVLAFLAFVHPGLGAQGRVRDLETKRELVQRWQITDLCLLPEARYTRHVSQADLHAAFQDHPGARDHFPAGSMVAPPLLLRGGSTLHPNSAEVDDAKMD